MFNPWQFGLDVHEEITTRVLRMMTGELSPREARRMINEKQTFYSRALSQQFLTLCTPELRKTVRCCISSRPCSYRLAAAKMHAIILDRAIARSILHRGLCLWLDRTERTIH